MKPGSTTAPSLRSFFPCCLVFSFEIQCSCSKIGSCRGCCPSFLESQSKFPRCQQQHILFFCHSWNCILCQVRSLACFLLAYLCTRLQWYTNFSNAKESHKHFWVWVWVFWRLHTKSVLILDFWLKYACGSTRRSFNASKFISKHFISGQKVESSFRVSGYSIKPYSLKSLSRVGSRNERQGGGCVVSEQEYQARHPSAFALLLVWLLTRFDRNMMREALLIAQGNSSLKSGSFCFPQ